MVHAGLVERPHRAALQLEIAVRAGQRYVVEQQSVQVLARVYEVLPLLVVDGQVGGPTAVYSVHLSNRYETLRYSKIYIFKAGKIFNPTNHWKAF